MSSGKDIGGEVCVNYENLAASFVGLSVWIRVIHRQRSSVTAEQRWMVMGMSVEEMDTIACAVIAVIAIFVYALWDIFRKR